MDDLDLILIAATAWLVMSIALFFGNSFHAWIRILWASLVPPLLAIGIPLSVVGMSSLIPDLPDLLDGASSKNSGSLYFALLVGPGFTVFYMLPYYLMRWIDRRLYPDYRKVLLLTIKG